MLPDSFNSLFAIADNFALELSIGLALIWLATLGYVAVRKVSAILKRSGSAPAHA
jgi:hypothetical protein